MKFRVFVALNMVSEDKKTLTLVSFLCSSSPHTRYDLATIPPPSWSLPHLSSTIATTFLCLHCSWHSRQLHCASLALATTSSVIICPCDFSHHATTSHVLVPSPLLLLTIDDLCLRLFTLCTLRCALLLPHMILATWSDVDDDSCAFGPWQALLLYVLALSPILFSSLATAALVDDLPGC